jgi:hypothetical protein
MSVVGAYPEATITGEDELPGKFHYFVGNDPSLWRTNVPSFAKVRYHEVYPGIDLVYYGNEGQLEYDFVVAPGADPGRIELAIDGADSVEVEPNGDLRLEVAGRVLRWRKPVLFQEVAGRRVPVPGEYVLQPRAANATDDSIRRVRFRIPEYDRSLALVIDPVLAYSTFLGGWYGDGARAVAVDAGGCAYVTGQTFSSSSVGEPFPTTPGAFRRSFLEAAAFVTKFNATGDQLVYSTFLCGTGGPGRSSGGSGIAVDDAGSAIVTGGTGARDFPRKNAVQSTYGGGDTDAFVTQLSPDGSALVFSTYLGGRGSDTANNRVKLDAGGNVYVAGMTESPNFPTLNPVQAVYGGDGDWFLTKLDATGTNLLYSTFLGGTTREVMHDLAVDPAGHAYVAGMVSKSGEEGYGILVRKLNTSGTSMEYAASLTNAYVNAIDVDRHGALHVVGSLSGTLPTTSNAFQPMPAGDDAFVGKLNAGGTGWDYLTYLGGTSDDGANAIAVDASGNAYVAGSTRSTDFPVRDALQEAHGSSDYGVTCFVSKLNPTGSGLVWSTYLGGSSGDQNWSLGERPNALTVDPSGGVYVVGDTSSYDFPVLNAFQSEPSTPGHRPFEAFVTKILDPATVVPVIQIARSGSMVTISWPVSVTGLILEFSDSIAPTPDWQFELRTPQVVGDQNVVTLELGAAPRFFRLAKP